MYVGAAAVLVAEGTGLTLSTGGSLRFTPGNLCFTKSNPPIKVSVVKRKPGLYFGLVSLHVSLTRKTHLDLSETS